MDAARMAAMSDPVKNYNFNRRWREPPQERERPPIAATIEGAWNSFVDSSENDNTRSARLIQWAFHLDRVADAELAVGRSAAAERLAHQAQELRETAA